MSKAARLFPLAIVVALAVSRPATGDDADRETPPERMSRDRQVELAAQPRPHAPIGPVGPLSSLATTTLTWTPLGPAPIEYDYWSSGPSAGRVSAVVVDPRSAGTVYIAAAQGGVWKTTNGGAGWVPLTDGLSSLASGALALDPTNPDIVYYATGEMHESGDSFYGDGVFRSTDAGATWTKLAGADQIGAYVSKIAVRASNPRVLYASSSMGFVRSLDGGAHWTQTETSGWCFDLAITPTDSMLVYSAFDGAGVFKSTDGGASFDLLTGGLPTAGLHRINIAMAPSAPNTVYASFVNPNGSLLGMFKTTDAGATWALLPATPNYLGTQGWYDNCVIVDPLNAGVCFAGGVYPYVVGYAGIIRTTDGGVSWQDVTLGVDTVSVHPDQHAFAYGPDHTLWIVNDGGVWRTSDGGQHWQDRNTNLAVTQFYSAALHPGDPDRILGGTQDNGTVTYAGAPVWTQVIAGDGGSCLFLWNDPRRYFTTYVQLDPVYSWNEFGFVATVTGPWGVENDRASFGQAPLVGDPNTPDAMLAGTYRVWRTLNLGASWDSLSNDLTAGIGYLRAVTVAPGAPNTIWAGTSNGELFITTNASFWRSRSTGLPAAPITDIELDPANPQNGYISSDGATGRVWRTTSTGVSWTDASGDLPVGIRGLCLAADFPHGVLYLGTDYGVWRSTNGGTHWQKENAGLPSVAIYDLKLGPYGNTLIAATHGRGMWRGTRSMLADRGTDVAASTIALVAENPAQLPTAIEFQLPHGSHARLDVVDVGGRRVRRVADADYPAGRHAATWDGREESGARAAPGVYFYRLTAGVEIKVLRVAVLR